MVAGLAVPMAMALTTSVASPAQAAGTITWNLNEAKGAKNAFSSPGGHTGAVGSGITTGGGSYRFTGGGVVRIPSAPALNPGNRNFEFSVRFKKATSGGEYNLFQKRLAGTRNGQWKIDTTFGDQYCVFRGDKTADLTGRPTAAQGVAKVRKTLAPGAWYTITCKKTANAISITVKNAGGGVIASKTERKAVGALPANTAPVTIGGKAPCKRGCDYFRGQIDWAKLTIS